LINNANTSNLRQNSLKCQYLLKTLLHVTSTISINFILNINNERIGD
jgi:hypothetical protein